MDIQFLREVRIEELAEKVHLAWFAEKSKQGFHPPMQCPVGPRSEAEPIVPPDRQFTKHCDKCHPDMYAYHHLPENIKEYDRVTVRTVLDAIGALR